VDNLYQSSNIIALIVRGDCTNQPFFKKDTAVLSLGSITILQSYKLCTTQRLATRHIDKQEQPLEKLVHLLKVRLHYLFLPPKLRFCAYIKQFVPKPVVLKYSVKQLSIAALLELVYVALIFQEIPAFLPIVVIILEAIEID
jgi:hypothetical protein